MAHSVPVGATGSDVAEMRSVAVGSLSEAALRVAGQGAYSSGSTQVVCETALWVCEPISESRRPERSFWSLSIEGWTLQLWVRWARSVTDRHQEGVAAL